MKIVKTLKRIEVLQNGCYRAYAKDIKDAIKMTKYLDLSDALDDKARALKKELRLYIKATKKYNQLRLAKRYLNIKS